MAYQAMTSELASSSDALNRANNALHPGELPGVFTDRTFDFFAIFVPPDAIFLGSQTIEMRVCNSG